MDIPWIVGLIFEQWQPVAGVQLSSTFSSQYFSFLFHVEKDTGHRPNYRCRTQPEVEGSGRRLSSHLPQGQPQRIRLK